MQVRTSYSTGSPVPRRTDEKKLASCHVKRQDSSLHDKRKLYRQYDQVYAERKLYNLNGPENYLPVLKTCPFILHYIYIKKSHFNVKLISPFHLLILITSIRSIKFIHLSKFLFLTSHSNCNKFDKSKYKFVTNDIQDWKQGFLGVIFFIVSKKSISKNVQNFGNCMKSNVLKK